MRNTLVLYVIGNIVEARVKKDYGSDKRCHKVFVG